MGEERTARIGQRRPEFHLGILHSCTQLWLATFLSFEVTVTVSITLASDDIISSQMITLAPDDNIASQIMTFNPRL